MEEQLAERKMVGVESKYWWKQVKEWGGKLSWQKHYVYSLFSALMKLVDIFNRVE